MTRTSSIVLKIIFWNSPYWEIKTLIHAETHPHPCLSRLKREQELKVQYTTFPRCSREREMWELDKTFCIAQRCFLDPAEKIAGADYVGCAVDLEMPWTLEEQWGMGARCTKSAPADSSLNSFPLLRGIFFAPFAPAGIEELRTAT